MIAAIYSRKSVFTEKSESVENQVAICKQYGQNKGIDQFLIYEDEGFSGKNTDRPGFKRMMADAKRKKFSCIISYRLDRFSRNVADFAGTYSILQKLGIDFISVREQFDTTSVVGRGMMNISAVFAQMERESTAERVTDNMIELAKTGRWLGGTAPLGYKSEPVKYIDANNKNKVMKKLVIVPEEAEQVKFIFQLFIERKAFSSVANYLCRNRYVGKNGGEFSRNTVQQIITNPVYCIADDNAFEFFKLKNAKIYGSPSPANGLMVYNKRKGGKKLNTIDKWILAIGMHEGIIPSKTWIMCQEIYKSIQDNSISRPNNGEKFLLAGLIKCGCCGSSISSWSHFNSKSNKMERYYRCNLKNRAANRCESTMLNADKAEKLVVDYIKGTTKDMLISQFNDYAMGAAQKKNIDKTISGIEKDISKNNELIEKLIHKMAYLDDSVIDEISKEIKKIKGSNASLKDKLNLIQEEKLKCEMNEMKFNDILKKIDNFKKLYDSLSSIDDKKYLINTVVKSIIWDSNNGKLVINLIGSK